MTRRIIVGGPSGSGKSTFVLSLVECLKLRGLRADAVELDVWSNSYLAFSGQYAFENRPKRFTLHDWDWKAAIAPRIAGFNQSDADFVFGDLPGVVGAANSHTLGLVRPTDAWVYSRTLEGIADWKRFFEKDFGIRVTREFLSVRKADPVVVPDLDRKVDAGHACVMECAHQLLDAPTP